MKETTLPDVPDGWRWHSLTRDDDGFQFVMISLYGNAVFGQGSSPAAAIEDAIKRRESHQYVAEQIHNSIANQRGLPLWDQCPQDVRDAWIKAVKEAREIGKGITYED